ncbi:hypothetical protein SLEP1_g43947 [Rubroshorea leprosula]|uniref:Uncharacterized protein n=1 Tax=Rubroshorea leprosula TaxID=152421 RepID=A0AAV5LF22_9ROSI|nr:hypothetical protein SLEP1_g43947 [Rubroshorea leprosula]
MGRKKTRAKLHVIIRSGDGDEDEDKVVPGKLLQCPILWRTARIRNLEIWLKFSRLRWRKRAIWRLRVLRRILKRWLDGNGCQSETRCNRGGWKQ